MKFSEFSRRLSMLVERHTYTERIVLVTKKDNKFGYY